MLTTIYNRSVLDLLWPERNLEGCPVSITVPVRKNLDPNRSLAEKKDFSYSYVSFQNQMITDQSQD
jgi:hypothetical protein